MSETEKHGLRKNKKKVMNMNARVFIKSNGTAIDSHEIDNTLSSRVQALLHARDIVGFANALEEDHAHAPLEATMDIFNVPLATVNDFADTFQLRGLDDMTVVDNCDAMKEVRDKLIETVGNDRELLMAIMDCSLGQLFLIVEEIKKAVDGKE